MKFTYPQKKWVLTTALLAVLGVNVSLNSHSDGIASADFASTSGDLMESKVYTADGVMPVKYIDNGDEEVLALVPKKTTEGKICEGKCGYDTITLSVKNKSDIDSLNVELMKQLAKDSAATKKKVVKKEEVEEEDAVEEKEEVVVKKKIDYFASIRRDCGSNETDSEKLSCYSDRLPDLLSEKKKITTADANQFFSKEVQPALLRNLSDARQAAYIASLRQQLGYTVPNTEDNRAAILEAQDSLDNTLNNLESFIAKIPSGFESIRQKVFIAQAEVLKYEATLAQETANKAKTATDVNQKGALLQEADSRLVGTRLLADRLVYTSNQGLSDGRYADKLTQTNVKSYQEYLSQNILTAMGLLGGTTALPAQVTVPGIDLSARLQTPGRGANIGTIPGVTPVQNSQIGVIPQQGTTTAPTATNPVSSRTGATTLSAPLTTSGGVSFGAPRDATAEALQMRQQIRGRQ
ncbi:hypothetical protein EZJ49_14670 [Bdellovibrio bacteriovorus]|uniref:hypothetical protein n=1 Tax=Bdellovibrio bacteriovorus TaxID=959 RepID=UPI0021D3C082|nr:hypothetical protein [Bdellovibrio bacteriovorus]UXR64309.1 hypothetical protein EZJ49_14670 [Bdellovibrio bacteriovorus]